MKLKPLIIGNWKLNMLRNEAYCFINFILDNIPATFKGNIAIAPAMVLLQTITEKVYNSKIQVVAQNVAHKLNGAFTGESSVSQIKELGVSMAIIGHSERKQHFKETLENIFLKTKICLSEQVTPIVCIGEKKFDSVEKVEKVVNNQLDSILKSISAVQLKQIIIAYEPVWAIGKGIDIDIFRIEKIHQWLRKKIGVDTCLIYGGSVTPKNAKKLACIPNIDGFLVGNSSLNANEFLEIVKAYL